jgi:hypothetical protein
MYEETRDSNVQRPSSELPGLTEASRQIPEGKLSETEGVSQSNLLDTPQTFEAGAREKGSEGDGLHVGLNPPQSNDTEPSTDEKTSKVEADAMPPQGYAQLLAERDFLRTRLEEQTRRRTYTDQALDERQKELQRKEAMNKNLMEEVARANEELKRAQDHIFRLQPRRTEITETEAVESFHSLFENVKRWVQNRLDPILRELDDGRLESLRPPSHSTRLLALVRAPAKDWLKAHQSDEFHIIAVIMQYLRRAIFMKPFYCPLDDPQNDDKTMQFIDKVLSAMARLPRGTCSHTA